MKKSILYFLLPLLTFTIISCNPKDGKENLDLEKDFQTVEIENDFRLKLPKYMEETDQLNEEAILQYQNTKHKLFIIIIEEPIDEVNESYTAMTGEDADVSFSDYVDLYMEMIEEDPSIRFEDKSEVKTTRINGNICKTLEVGAYIDPLKNKIYYQYAIFKGKDKYYTMLLWTMDKEKEKVLNTIDQIVNSFETIK